MSIVEITRGLIQALKTEGTAGASWGDRVYLTTASSVVETTGEPKSKAWPCLELVGPGMQEVKLRRAVHQREQTAVDHDAGTMTVRPIPRFYNVSFAVTYQTRAGVTTGITATEQLCAAIERWEAWLAKTPTIAGFPCFPAKTLSADNARRLTPADIREASGRITIRDVPIYQGTSEDVSTSGSIVVGVNLDS